MGKHHNHSNGHDMLEVTVTYKGHPKAIDDAIHGATRETEWWRAALERADTTIDELTEAIGALTSDLAVSVTTAEDLALDLAAERRTSESLRNKLVSAQNRVQEEDAAKWRASDRAYMAEQREAKLKSEVEDKQRAIVKLQAALGALGAGQISVEDIAAFVVARDVGFDVNKPVANPNRPWSDSSTNYPWAMLTGSKDNVRQAVLACFVNDPERREKIQAIKNLRERTGLGVKDAKDLIEWAIGERYTDR